MRTDLSRIDNLRNHARGEPYTGATPTFGCGHPRTPENTYIHKGRPNGRCRRCAIRSASTYQKIHPRTYNPVRCRSCGEPLGDGRAAPGGYHSGACEPTTCTCDTPRPDGLGECQGCHRLALANSWHDGRPT